MLSVGNVVTTERVTSESDTNEWAHFGWPPEDDRLPREQIAKQNSSRRQASLSVLSQRLLAIVIKMPKWQVAQVVLTVTVKCRCSPLHTLPSLQLLVTTVVTTRPQRLTSRHDDQEKIIEKEEIVAVSYEAEEMRRINHRHQEREIPL